MLNKSSFKEWFDRYKYAELSATSTVLAGSQLHWFFDGLTTAYLITFAEYFAFYGVILCIEFHKLKTKNELLDTKTTLKEVVLILRNLLLEFGYPAILDFFVVRPFFMFWMPIVTGNYFMGIILGKITADLTFYTLTIFNFELLKKKR
jgi:hypothetical protein